MTAARLELQAHVYFSKPCAVLLSSAHLVSFVILDITLLTRDYAEAPDLDEALLLAEAEVAKESDLGANDTTYRVLTHLGRVLKPGDVALGYDLQHTVVNETEFEAMVDSLPDVILVKKSYAEKDKEGKAPVSGRKFRKKKHEIYKQIKQELALEEAELAANSEEGTLEEDMLDVEDESGVEEDVVLSPS